MKSRWTLGQIFYLSLIGLSLLLALLFYLLLDGSRKSIVDSSERLREAHSRRIAGQVESYLNLAQGSVEAIENQLRNGAGGADGPSAIEPCLFAQILTNNNLAEATLSHASSLGYDSDGNLKLAERDRWQVSLFRESAAVGASIGVRTTFQDHGGFVSEMRAPGSHSEGRREEGVEDPTQHLTFSTTAAKINRGQIVWSDLSFTQLDERLPEMQRRVVVTVMKAIEDKDGRFLGVLRIGLLTEQLDEMIRKESAENAPHRIFICDSEGRLITRVSPGDRMVEDSDEALRVAPVHLPSEVALALHHPALGLVTSGQLNAFGELTAGQKFFVSFRGLPRTQEWCIGIVVPQSHYLGKLNGIRNNLIVVSLFLIAAILIGGVATLRMIRRGLRQIERQTARMRRFEFSASGIESPFRDVSAVLEGLERAKTAVRAMGKYVPIDLVHQLYEANREPVLGGELREVSLMFTDIKEFTNLAERLSPDELARILGRYLEVMTVAIQANSGTVDKYIGDAVMVIWNSPSPCPDHAVKACEAALACIEATRQLFDSPQWGGMPPLVTRFGLHRDEVMVGHFGAPDRMSFTALGDGVNLASRLESLNKQYRTTIIVSEMIYSAAAARFDFRLLDRVAVKGKSRGIEVYELLGIAGQQEPRVMVARTYEKALQSYFSREFREAVELLKNQLDDGPSSVLTERCLRLAEQPPPAGWDGIHVSSVK
ncbi:MAG TPA: adenylate/guanylate cyclase domain-containing protein [Thermoanaerobaculia bacterium]|nr:adenylate/guanylate cyclase domain-containing protein [Thermoanaerobaculia bacterium]